METLINILLADDDLDEHLFFREALNKTNTVGHHVTSVYDGVQLLDFVMKRNNYRNSKEPLPDIIVVDLNMPLMDGFEAIKQLKAAELSAAIPIYVLTTSANTGHLIKCRELGCAGYFTKQVKNDKLAAIIGNMLCREATQI